MATTPTGRRETTIAIAAWLPGRRASSTPKTKPTTNASTGVVKKRREVCHAPAPTTDAQTRPFPQLPVKTGMAPGSKHRQTTQGGCMKIVTKALGVGTGLALLLGGFTWTASAGAVCPADSVVVGTACLDKYEASV